MKKYKKIALFCFAAMFLLLFGTDQVFAAPQCQIKAKKGVTIDLERMAECMEDRYGFDKDSLRRGNKKKMVPTVEISFNKTDPKEGEKVTALSSPKGFKNDMTDLYYTWYIIHTDDEGNYLNTISDGKREAMGIIARGEFDAELFGINYAAIPPGAEDEDGYDAAYGGDDGVGAKPGQGIGSYDDDPAVMFDAKKQIVEYDEITRCYRHNFGKQVGRDNMGDSSEDGRAGRDRIIRCSHEFVNAPAGRVGDGSFGVAEEAFWGTDPTNPDTDGDGIEDEADLAGLNQTQFTWIYKPGDRVGVVVEGTSMIPISEGGNQTDFNISGYRVTDPVTGATRDFGSRAAASAFCESFLPDTVDMGAASAAASGGSGGSGGGALSGGSGGSGGSSSVNVDLDADMAAYNTGMARYDACDDSLEEIYTSGVVVDSEDGKLNAYYKIMWATPGICSTHDNSMDIRRAAAVGGGAVTDDDCEPGNSDWGFPYLATVSVNETGSAILDPELSVIPENPQFDAVELNVDKKRSDLITVNTSLSNEAVNEDFLFYQWQVDRCNGNDFTDCNHPIPNLKYETYTSGMGVRELKFFPTSDVFGAVPGLPAMAATENKAWVRVTVIVSEHESLAGGTDTDVEGRTVGAIEKIYFPITKNVANIKLYRAVRVGGQWAPGPEICANNLYRDICPVYPYQVILAEAVTSDGTLAFDRYAWQMNNNKLAAVETCRIAGGIGCGVNPDFRTFIPIQAVQDEIVSLTVANKRDNAGGGSSDFISQRILSVSSPKPVIEIAAGATATTRFDGTLSDSVFEADDSVPLTFRAIPVPRYLTINNDAIQEDHEVDLVWYINDMEVDAQFIADNRLFLNAATAGDQITITIPNDMTLTTGINLKARFVKKFSTGGVNEYVEMTKDTWRINDIHTLAQDHSITIRRRFNMALAQDTTLKQYIASSISNAPYYLIFTIRLSIAMVLIWSVLFGFSYAVKLNKEL